MYRIEVHTACVVGHLIRIPEAQCSVEYPSGIHHPAFVAGRDGQFEDWFSGWNATTDLYRLLEHAIVSFRTTRNTHGPHGTILRGEPQVETASVLDRLSAVQKRLLPQFSQAFPGSTDNGRNRCGFQATNIFCPIHLVRMLAFISEEASIQSACQTAQRMIASMSTIPPEYVRAIGSPLLRKLAGVGHILSSVASKQELSGQDYLQLRNVLLSMADFLHSLKGCNETAEGQALRLGRNVERLDQDKLQKVGAKQRSSPLLLMTRCTFSVRREKRADEGGAMLT